MQKEKILLTALSNFGNSSSVRFLCLRNIYTQCHFIAKNNGICLESGQVLFIQQHNPLKNQMYV